MPHADVIGFAPPPEPCPRCGGTHPDGLAVYAMPGDPLHAVASSPPGTHEWFVMNCYSWCPETEAPILLALSKTALARLTSPTETPDVQPRPDAEGHRQQTGPEVGTPAEPEAAADAGAE